MSADRYTTCPRCVRQRNEKIEKLQSKLDDAYGRVDLKEFDRMRTELSKLREKPLGISVREDYEFYGFESGEVHAHYTGTCSRCGLSLSFQTTHPVEQETCEA